MSKDQPQSNRALINIQDIQELMDINETFRTMALQYVAGKRMQEAKQNLVAERKVHADLAAKKLQKIRIITTQVITYPDLDNPVCITKITTSKGVYIAENLREAPEE